MKIDRMIVATAVSRKADCIYSEDEGLKAFAEGYIPVYPIPYIAKQVEAFDITTQKDWGTLPKNADRPTK